MACAGNCGCQDCAPVALGGTLADSATLLAVKIGLTALGIAGVVGLAVYGLNRRRRS